MARRSENSGDSRRYYEWLDHAETDLRAARVLGAAGADSRTVVYHCHQVLEKALKSFILYSSREHVDGHNITYLMRRSAREDRRFEKFVRRTPDFNSYYIQTRYPTDLPFEIDAEAVADAFSLAQEVYGLVARTIAEALNDDIKEDENL